MLDFLISPAYAQAAQQPPSLLVGWGFPILLLAIFYFVLIRPQQKKVKEHRDMLGKLAKGDEVVASGGIAGTVREIGENFITVEIADGVQVKMEKGSVGRVLPKGSLKAL